MRDVKPNVRVDVSSDDGQVWLTCIVDGYMTGPRVYVDSVDTQADYQVKGVVERAYVMAYRRGVREAQKAIRDAIGYTEDI